MSHPQTIFSLPLFFLFLVIDPVSPRRKLSPNPFSAFSRHCLITKWLKTCKWANQHEELEWVAQLDARREITGPRDFVVLGEDSSMPALAFLEVGIAFRVSGVLITLLLFIVLLSHPKAVFFRPPFLPFSLHQSQYQPPQVVELVP